MKKMKETSFRWLQLFRTNVSFWIAAGICSPFLSAYYKSIGLTSTQIGILFAVSPICAICIQPLWAYVSDRTGKRRAMLTGLSVCTAMAFLLYYCGQSFAVCLAATVAISLFSPALLPLCDALVIDRAEAYRCNFATIRIGGTLGYALIVVLSGFFLEYYPSTQFALAWGAYLIFAVVAWRIPLGEEKEGKAEKTENVQNRQKAAVNPKSTTKGIFVDNEIGFVLMYAFVVSVGLGFCGSFIGVYAVELGYSQGLIGILSCVSALSEVPILLCALGLTKRYGELPLLAFSAFMTGLRLLLVGLGLVPTMLAGQLLQSVTYMTTYYCCTRYISTHVREGKISQGQSILAMVQSGLASMAANLLGGWLVDRLGTRNAFYLMAGFVLTAAVISAGLFRTYQRSRKEEERI